MPTSQQALAREVLRSMTVAGRDGGLARRPVTRDDLYAGLPGAARADRSHTLVTRRYWSGMLNFTAH